MWQKRSNETGENTMNIILKHCAILAGITCIGSAHGGDQMFDFNDPSAPPGLIIIGTRAATALQSAGGNPGNGGYIGLTAANTSENCGVVFPDVDLFTNRLGTVVSLPIKAIRFEADLRVGNGTRRPADGFSISFARANDPALRLALQDPPAFGGWAGGDSLGVASDPQGNGNPETGTHTGLAISFDTWQGNWLPINGVVTDSMAANDVEGIAVRLDDVTLIQVPMGNRNGGCFITEINPADPCAIAAQAALDSMQTGPWSGFSSSVGDFDISDRSFDRLSWQRFTAEINANKQVTVTWKGHVILDHYQVTNYPASQGRLILAARAGACTEHTHMDNIRLVTTPAVEPVLDPNCAVTVGLDSFRINLLNVGTAVVTNFPFISLDNTDITAQVVLSNYLDVATYGTYRNTHNFLAGSPHSVHLVYEDTLGQRITNSLTFVGLALAEALVLPASAADRSKPGFIWRIHQVGSYQEDSCERAERQLVGQLGNNIADWRAQGSALTIASPPSPATAPITFEIPSVINLSMGGWQSAGNFVPDNSMPGLPGMYGSGDYAVAEILTWLELPAGTITLGVNSDDGFRMRVGGARPGDALATTVGEFNGPRGASDTLFSFYAPQSGLYAVRCIWEQGVSDANIELFSVKADGSRVLVNDTVHGGIAAYRSVTALYPLSQTAEVGSDVRFGLAQRPSGTETYQWFLNGTNAILSSATDATLRITNVQPAQAGMYTVVLTRSGGGMTSSPAMLNVIAPVQRRSVPALALSAQVPSSVRVESTYSLDAPTWTPLATLAVTTSPQFYFDLSSPLPANRFYRAFAAGTAPSLDLHLAPAITVTGAPGTSVRLDYINQFGPTNAWVNLATVALTNTSQLYFDTSAIHQPARLYRLSNP